jgi:hypothetical protein
MARIGVQAMMLKNEFEADGAFTTLMRLNELGLRRPGGPRPSEGLSHRSAPAQRLPVTAGR